MPQSDPTQFSGIFVSYRRDDSAGHVGRLCDGLSAHFGAEQIFMDIDHIEPGEDFVQVVEDAVGSCAVLLAVIGRSWLTSADAAGRRLDNPHDFVRLEIATALDRNIRVIPVLVHGATMPKPQDLPDALSQLSRRNALELSDVRWKHDADRLIGILDKLLNNRREPRRVEVTEASSSVSHLVSQTVVSRTDIELVWIPPGNFIMGTEKIPNERPAHRVTFREGFYMGKYEVTQAQWQAVMGSNPSHFKWDNLPVEQVTWDDAVAFIARLNAQDDGHTYRLPSEAEWEYACRAGTTGDYAGDLDAMAWYWKSPGGKTHPVGCKQPNAFGLFDMHGNVWEWCQDWYHDTYAGAPTDGRAWVSGGEQKYRVIRGGSWKHDASFCRSAHRFKNSWISRHFLTVGLRVAAVARK
jgi:formylglycine-generating enzyme required for sulfatase activity